VVSGNVKQLAENVKRKNSCYINVRITLKERVPDRKQPGWMNIKALKHKIKDFVREQGVEGSGWPDQKGLMVRKRFSPGGW